MEPFRRRPSGENELVATPGSATRLRAAPANHGAFQRSSGYAKIRAILSKYLSAILVESVLQKSIQSRHLSPDTLSAADLADLTGDIMVGLRLFVPSERLPELMLELADVLDLEQL
jgi:hypothetical protein